MAKYIKNISGGDKTYQGQTISDGAYHLIPKSDEYSWANDVSLLLDIIETTPDAIVCSSNSAAGELSDKIEGLNYLKELEIKKTETIEEISAGGASNLFHGFKFTALKNTTTTFDWKVPVDFHLHNGYLEADNLVFKDSISMKVVDVDGVYYPAGTVLKMYVENINIPKSGHYKFDSNKKTETSLKDLYIRVEYTSLGLTNDVDVIVNMRGFDS